MRTLPLFTAALALAAAMACAPGGGSGSFEDSLLAVGAPAPDVTVQRLDGSSLALSSLRGKTVLLNFWFHH